MTFKVYISTTEQNRDLIQHLLDSQVIPPCQQTISLIDAFMIACAYEELVEHIGLEVSTHILKYLEAQEEYEECVLLHDCIEEYKECFLPVVKS